MWGVFDAIWSSFSQYNGSDFQYLFIVGNAENYRLNESKLSSSMVGHKNAQINSINCLESVVREEKGLGSR